MTKHNPNIDPFEKAFKDAFDNFEPKVDAKQVNSDWSSVSNQIGAAPAGSGQSALFKAAGGLKTIGIVGGLAVLIVTSVILLKPKQETNIPNVPVQNVPENVKEVNNDNKHEIIPEQTPQQEAHASNQTTPVQQESVDPTMPDLVPQKSASKKSPPINQAKIEFGTPAYSGKIIIHDSILCLGDSLQVSIQRELPGEKIFIYLPDGRREIKTAYFACRLNSQGSYLLRFDINKPDGLKIIRYKNIIILPLPVAAFRINMNQMPKVNFMNQSKNFDYLSWNFGDGYTSAESNASHKYSDTGLFKVKLIVSYKNECFDTNVQSLVIKKYPEVYIPNIFTPDGDGIHDYYKISIEHESYYSLIIFDRNRHEVFKSENKNEYWDGSDMKTGKECPEGTYFYLLNYKFEKDGPIIPRQGSITLVR